MMEPILRLFHISDLHFAPYASMKSGAAPRWQQWLQGGQLGRWFLMNQGTQGHDPAAVFALRQSIIDWAQMDEDDWRGKAFLVATGDFSTWGDIDSILDAKKFVDDLASCAGLRSGILYGNHDVWPGKPHSVAGIPLLEAQDALDAHRSDVRLRAFSQDWVEEIAISGLSRPFKLLAVNTVLHERLRNTFALGHIREDRYWQGNPAATDQLEQVANALSVADVAVLITHHPAHIPRGVRSGPLSWLPPWWLLGTQPKALENASDFASKLSVRTPTAKEPIRLVVSGHSHEVFPPPGALEGGKPSTRHAPLDGNCLQFTVGTTTQECLSNTDPKKSQVQTWEMLSLWLDAPNAELTIERTVLCRRATGPFIPLSAPHAPSRTAETTILRIS